jgi:hypothetical protein
MEKSSPLAASWVAFLNRSCWFIVKARKAGWRPLSLLEDYLLSCGGQC